MNNFELITAFCEKMECFKDNDSFLFGQVMVRKKDGSKYTKSNNRIIKDITFRSVDDIKNKMNEIIEICDIFKARAYINITPKSFKTITIDMAGICLDYVRSGGEMACRSIFSTACGRSKPKNGFWIIDIDNMKDYDDIKSVVPYINLVVPTVNGVHIICKGFDLREFRLKYPDVDIHKNNPTLLYSFNSGNR